MIKTKWNERAIIVALTKKDDVRLISKILEYKVNSSSREDEVSKNIINAYYKKCVSRIEIKPCEIQKQ